MSRELPCSSKEITPLFVGYPESDLTSVSPRIGNLKHFSRRAGAACSPGRARWSATVAGAGQASQHGGGERRRGALGGPPRDGRRGKAGGGAMAHGMVTLRQVSPPPLHARRS